MHLWIGDHLLPHQYVPPGNYLERECAGYYMA